MTNRGQSQALVVLMALSLVCLGTPLYVAMPQNTFWAAVPFSLLGLWLTANRRRTTTIVAACYPLVPLLLLGFLFVTSGE